MFLVADWTVFDCALIATYYFTYAFMGFVEFERGSLKSTH